MAGQKPLSAAQATPPPPANGGCTSERLSQSACAAEGRAPTLYLDYRESGEYWSITGCVGKR